MLPVCSMLPMTSKTLNSIYKLYDNITKKGGWVLWFTYLGIKKKQIHLSIKGLKLYLNMCLSLTLCKRFKWEATNLTSSGKSMKPSTSVTVITVLTELGTREEGWGSRTQKRRSPHMSPFVRRMWELEYVSKDSVVLISSPLVTINFPQPGHLFALCSYFPSRTQASPDHTVLLVANHHPWRRAKEPENPKIIRTLKTNYIGKQREKHEYGILHASITSCKNGVWFRAWYLWEGYEEELPLLCF